MRQVYITRNTAQDQDTHGVELSATDIMSKVISNMLLQSPRFVTLQASCEAKPAVLFATRATYREALMHNTQSLHVPHWSFAGRC